MTPETAAPFVLHALAAAQPAGLTTTALRRISWRIALMEHIGENYQIMVMAAAASRNLALVATTPGKVPPPPGLEPAQYPDWLQLTQWAERAQAEYYAAAESILQSFETINGLIPTATMTLPEPDSADKQALIDEALAALEKSPHDPSTLVLDRAAWAIAASILEDLEEESGQALTEALQAIA